VAGIVPGHDTVFVVQSLLIQISVIKMRETI
jgi:hypothetical protein